MSLEWVIIGGGIHGVHIATRLIGEVGVTPGRLRIIDPHPRLLSRWRTCTATTGMTHLRSPSVHHLDLTPWDLERFAGKRRRHRAGLFASPYNRPSLDLFNLHCDHVLERYGLADLHIQDQAQSCSVNDDGVIVELSGGQTLAAENLVLAIGVGEQPDWPAWAPTDHARVSHIFQPGFDGLPDSPERVAIVGGGISACQTALRLTDQGHQVHLISRHASRVHQFDSDSGWLGPKYMAGFGRETDRDHRRMIINKARHRGSVPPEVHRAMRGAVNHQRLRWHETQVTALTEDHDGISLLLADNTELNVARVLLATGFSGHRPGGTMIDKLVDSAALPCAKCGYPVVDSALRWHPHIYVSGPLAELELGPVARNIAGARRAGDRLVASVVSAKREARKAS